MRPDEEAVLDVLRWPLDDIVEQAQACSVPAREALVRIAIGAPLRPWSDRARAMLALGRLPPLARNPITRPA